uniref:WGS project CBMI000000000 data, contig CS3069_c003806 n=1 Tax=Fusarium clavum TaxID=2594811 RepID=A0A090N5Z5_9HYPO|nr:unnamed protein product [Fusarium clavum]
MSLQKVDRLAITSPVVLTELSVPFGPKDSAATGADSLPIGKDTHGDNCADFLWIGYSLKI